MGAFYDSCPEHLLEWVQKQKIFWVATAPLQPDGHVNVSPKGTYDCFHIVNANQIWYEDLTGSGNETISHIRENGRVTVMFVAFDGPPRIVRFFGTGKFYEYGTPEYDDFIPPGTRKPGSRAVIIVDVHKVSTSCGYTIPYYDFRADRTMLLEYMTRCEKADVAYEPELSNPNARESHAGKGMRNYWIKNNTTSIDGLPGVQIAPFAKETPRSSWTLAEAKANIKLNNGSMVAVKQSTKTSLDLDAKLVAAFSLGVLTTAFFMKLGGLMV